MAEATDRLKAVRMRAAHQHPYLATAIYAMVPVPCEQIPYAGVDKHWRLYYNPTALAELKVEQGVFIMLHEVAHLLRHHCDRAKEMTADPTIWNLAADAEINDNLGDEGLSMPGTILPERLGMDRGLLAETYYRHLMETAIKLPMSGQGNESEDKQGGSEAHGSVKVGNEQIDQPAMGGSCAHGKAEPWERQDQEAGETAKGKEVPAGLSKGKADLVARKTAEDIKQAQARGSVPGGWAVWADALLDPKVNWRSELRSSVRRHLEHQAGMVDYTFRRPNRRAATMPRVVLPSMRAPAPNVAILMDTSGSMSSLVNDAMAEIKGVLKAVGMGTVPVVSCDAAVHGTQQARKVSDVKLVGGGGTDMGVGLAEIAGWKRRPSMVVVLTDGYTPWPAEAPPFDVIVGALSDGHHNYCAPPAWAKVVEVGE